MLDLYAKKKFEKTKYEGRLCPVCKKECFADDKIEYIQTKQKQNIFIHTECVKKGVLG